MGKERDVGVTNDVRRVGVVEQWRGRWRVVEGQYGTMRRCAGEWGENHRK